METITTLEIIIDDLISKDNIRLIKYHNIIYISHFNVATTLLSYKLITSNLYDVLIEQLRIKDSLVVLIIDNNLFKKKTIVIDNINIFNLIINIVNTQDNINRYKITFYGINLDNIPIKIKN
jgi:hypothetical protein